MELYNEFYQMALLSLANRNRVSRETMRRTVHRVAIYHATQQLAGNGEGEGMAEAVKADMNEDMPMEPREVDAMHQETIEKGQQQLQSATNAIISN
jgi:hypothetical protein